MSAEENRTGARVRPFVSGEWMDGAAGEIDNVDPGTGRAIGTVSLADESQIRAALAAASNAFPAWSNTVASSRGAVLTRASELLRERTDEIARTLLLETGKTWGDARAEVQRGVDNFAWNGAEAGRVAGAIYPGVVPGGRRYSIPRPLGVAVVITAWNFPVVLATRKLGAALAAGCTVVYKASEEAPATASLIVRALIDAGLPAGVVNMVFGEPSRVSEQLLASPDVKVVSFTGSTRVGKLLAGLAAPNLIRPVLELGGHAPVIVWSDADIDRVIATTAPAKYGSAGQSCVAPSRYLVHESLYERFVEALAAQAKTYRLGHGDEEGTTLGAIISQARVDALVRLTEDARAKGARVVTGGRQVERDGYFFEPTVLADVPSEADVLTEEPFGPVSAVISVSSLDDAIELANATPYSFGAYLFSDSLTVRNRVTTELNASNIGINQMAGALADVPLGGLGNSGYGYEGGREGILAFSQLRLIAESTPPEP